MLPCIEIVTPSNRNQAAANLRAVSFSFIPSNFLHFLFQLNSSSQSQSVSNTVYRTYEIATIDEDRSAFNSESGGNPLTEQSDNRVNPATTNIVFSVT